jgi:hypothetical protein
LIISVPLSLTVPGLALVCILLSINLK